MDQRDISTPRSERKPIIPDQFLTQTQPSTPQSPQSVRKCPRTPQLKLLTPLKPPNSFLLSSRLKFLLVSRTSRAHSWPDLTPECARGLEWDPVLDYRTPDTRERWENVSPLRGSPAKRLFSWAFEGQLLLPSYPVVDDVFPLTDLDNDVTHDLTVKEYNFLPSTL